MLFKILHIRKSYGICLSLSDSEIIYRKLDILPLIIFSSWDYKSTAITPAEDKGYEEEGKVKDTQKASPYKHRFASGPSVAPSSYLIHTPEDACTCCSQASFKHLVPTVVSHIVFSKITLPLATHSARLFLL